MLTTFQDTNAFEVYNKALEYESFDFIKDAFLTQLGNMTELSELQRTAIRLAAEKLPYYPDSSTMVPDGELLGVLRVGWGDIGLSTSVPALTGAQREAIFGAVMGICKVIIDDAAANLTAVADLDTTLPTDWNTADPE